MLDVAINSLAHGLSMFDREAQLIVCNQTYLDIYGLSPSSIAEGISFEDILWRQVAAGVFTEGSATVYVAMQLAEAQRREIFTRIVKLRDGRFLSIWHKPLEDGGWISTHLDVTAQRTAEERIIYLAGHDSLTGLPNRYQLHSQIGRTLAVMGDGARAAVLYLDLDRFKSIKDTYGHAIGDTLLQQASQRLTECVGDQGSVARLGGDEFVVFQMASKFPSATTSLARTIVSRMSDPFYVDGLQVALSASAGIAIAPDSGRDAEQLLRNAALALHRAKKDGRGRFCLFEQGMDSYLQERRNLEIDLAGAIERNELEIVYQPIVRLPSCQVSGCEALLRWRHPQRGTIGPDVFVPVAEESGLIISIGAWVLQEACRQAATWHNSIRLAVNVSAVQFQSGTLALSVAAALRQSGLPSSRLDLEITESVLLNDNEETMKMLYQLRELGVKFSLDDFGTGFSSLSYLQRFPFDSLKVDRSFVDRVASSPDRAAIVRAILGLGRNLKKSVIAEGVETRDQLDWLSAEGCPEVQGYFFARPSTSAELPLSIRRFAKGSLTERSLLGSNTEESASYCKAMRGNGPA